MDRADQFREVAEQHNGDRGRRGGATRQRFGFLRWSTAGLNVRQAGRTRSDLTACAVELELPAVSIGDVTVAEGDAGSVVAHFLLSLSAPSAEEVLVDFTTADGNATAGADYVARAGRRPRREPGPRHDP